MAPSKQERAAALAAIRKGGKRDYQLKEAEAIYDEVDDETFGDVYKKRLDAPDFVVEDSKESTGYADNGMEDYDREYSSEDEPKPKKPKASTSTSTPLPKKPTLKRKGKGIEVAEGANPYLKPGQTPKSQPTAAVEQDFMDQIMGGLAAVPSDIKMTPRASTIRPPPPRKSYGSEPRSAIASSSTSRVDGDPARYIAGSSDGPTSNFTTPVRENDDVFAGMDFGGGGDDDFEMAEAAVELEEDDDDGFEVKTVDKKLKGPSRPRQLHNGILPTPTIPKPEPMELDILSSLPKPTIDLDAKPKGLDWRRATSSLAYAAPILSAEDLEANEEDLLPLPESLKNSKHHKAPAGKATPNVSALESDGNLRFWWFDYQEPAPGVLYLVGKVKVNGERAANKWVSAVVNVTGIKRKLFVLPRDRALDTDGVELDEDAPPDFDDVEADFNQEADDTYKLKNLECTQGFVRRKYAFALKGIPREESNWLEATCDFPPRGKVDIPMDAKSGTFSHVFGTNQSTFEAFVLDHKIMGPCWLDIKDPKLSTGNMTWTKLEVNASTSDIRTFGVDEVNRPTVVPTLTILSLSTRTVVNLKQNKKEIVCASARVWSNADIDSTLPPNEQASSVATFVRPLFGPFPKGFEDLLARLQRQDPRTAQPIPLPTEKDLLVRLLALIHAADPDVIVGHSLLDGELDVLLHRMKELKVEQWSQVGRFRRESWPRNTSTKFAANQNAQLVNGRLIVDLTSDGSKSIIDSVTWSLTEMCESLLKIERKEVDPEDHAIKFDADRSTAANLLEFVLLCEADSYFQMAIAHAVQGLPLTRQLTNLAGNSWNRTLQGNRAERNEFILLHRFTEKGFVCPDKLSHKEKETMDKAEEKLAEIANEKEKREQQALLQEEEEESAREQGRSPKILVFEKEEKVTIKMKKAKYIGGLVFEPKKGLWDRYILVMDFNSLYPSIIQEYDIDFSTIDWNEHQHDAEDQVMKREPCEGEPQGILPQLIASLVDRRRNVKRTMKDRDLKPGMLAQLEITQKALKLTANSMYGCLGYAYGRFYARPLASLTTDKGRDILRRTKADAESLDLDVIYGDTDSVMINTNQLDYTGAIKIGNEFKKLINDKYKKLEIDTDAVFVRMLLLSKKKYAAIKREEDGTEAIEVKGLDLKRREFSDVSKNASKYVLSEILSGKSTELAVEQIHDYLTTLGNDIRAGKIPLSDFIINKRLGKDPDQYPDAKSQPHVQVALRMLKKGQSARNGDVIPYVICLPEDGISLSTVKAVNAYHPDDLRKEDSTLRIDYGVYLSSQILAAVERLCQHLEGTEKARLAECLGLDALKHRGAIDAPEREFKTLESQLTDAQRFKDCKSFGMVCRDCKTEHNLRSISEKSENPFSAHGMRCVYEECEKELSLGSIITQVDLYCRKFINQFYEQWLVCDDTSCANRTRMMSVYGRRCLMSDCRGQMHFEYSDSQLYNQLLFFDGMFDGDAAITKAPEAQQEIVRALVEANRDSLRELRRVVTTHLSKNGRRFVSMKNLFSFVKIAS